MCCLFWGGGACGKSFPTSTPQCRTAGRRVKSVNMGPLLNRLRLMCLCVSAHVYMCMLVYSCLESPARKSGSSKSSTWRTVDPWLPDRDAWNIYSLQWCFPTKTKQFLTALFEAKWKLAVVVQIQTSRQTNWELTLSEVWDKLGHDLTPPQSLIEAAYVCHELLSSNIWGFSQPSNSWGLISWDLPWSVQESGLSEPPSEDWEAAVTRF